MGKSQYDYINAYNRRKYDRVTLMLPAGSRERLKTMAASVGLSLNAYIISKLPEIMTETKKGNDK